MCFDGFGCFEVGNNFTHPLGLPSSPDYIGASTWLYSRGRYETNPKQIDFRTVSSLEDMRELRANKPLFILIHGYRRSRKHIWISETIIALLAKADCNIITVDWGKTHSFFYPWTAAYDTALVGKLLALLVHSLMNRFPKAISASSIHAIGQSFGAHVASFFAKHFKNDTGLLVGRITGLDPAAPYFEGHNVHLSNTDAEFVDVIHTSAGKNHYSLRNGDLGFRSPIGHVDFYPNGGTRVQPGCEYKSKFALVVTVWPTGSSWRQLIDQNSTNLTCAKKDLKRLCKKGARISEATVEWDSTAEIPQVVEYSTSQLQFHQKLKNASINK
ncbi:pancreatic triacylglycerol lipase isoform X1 [Ixodes scapularis]|uniref:pancreatic triacylglycerol lipase isoform X1 n=1 Tax=Ixodes scapularis TaxID=6945 RepID=UPI001A9FC0D2|nr:pancreatic triacylglycerol lipase isoform X1 [Ixodes scapularis]